MNRSPIIKTISIIMLTAIICMAGQYHDIAFNKAAPLPTSSKVELESYKESLEVTIAQLKSELSGKEAELAALDKMQIQLEKEYHRLSEESKKLSERLNSLNADGNNQ